MTTEKMCHCGKPLHYSSMEIESTINKIIESRGEFIEIGSLQTHKMYKVPIHYIALHGIAEHLLSSYGFEEVV